MNDSIFFIHDVMNKKVVDSLERFEIRIMSHLEALQENPELLKKTAWFFGHTENNYKYIVMSELSRVRELKEDLIDYPVATPL